MGWLTPYSGVQSEAANTQEIRYWSNQSALVFKELPYERVMTPDGNLDMIKTLLRDGVVMVTNPKTPGVGTLREFANYCFGGLQKDPSRQEPNWKIEKKLSAASISYNPDLRLNNHTEQSLPNHGIPGLCLVFHYAQGSGANTLVDGFAVGEALRERDPEAFELLSTYSNPQERDLLKSRQDANQNHTNSLYLSSCKPIFQLDAKGRIVRVQYNEVFRVPSEIPFDKFKDWYSAYIKFAEMIHSPEFERNVPMSEGVITVVHNWRVLHGRAGSRDGSASMLQSEDRVLVGGTITRENLFSRARALLRQTKGVELFGPSLRSSL